MGEPYKANCYKLVAAIIPRAPIHVYAMSDSEILTIGHSNHPIVRFIDLLRLHGVTAVADIRSAPYSRFNPQFNKEALERVLREHGIAYVFLGKELGARSSDPNCYDGGQVRYERLAQTTQFHSGLARVTKGAKSHRIALMCAEKEPLECHRTLLVARELARQGVSVSHIHGDGHLERHHTAMSRLPAFVGLPGGSSFVGRRSDCGGSCDTREAHWLYGR